jgi:transcriptional/translational regulatory protein YebC/TACO1
VIKFFERKGHILIKKDAVSEEKLLEIALDSGAEDVKTEDDYYEIITDPKDFSLVNETIHSQNIPIEESGIKFLPLEGTEIIVDVDKAQKNLKLIETLENHDDVQAVYHNMLFTKELEEALK